jgi:PAS domain S-box-containing protein
LGDLSDTVYRGVFAQAPDAIVVVDRTGKILEANSQVEQLFGYGRLELLGQPIEILVPERLRTGHVSLRDGFTAHPHTRPMGQGLELFGRRKDGTEIPIEVALAPLDTEDGQVFLAMVRDVTHRKKAERALRESEHRLAAIFAHAPDGILAVDSAGRIVEANQQVEQLFGCQRADLIGQAIERLIPDRFHPSHVKQREAYVIHPHTRAMGQGMELFGRRADGTEFPIEVGLAPMEGEERPVFLAIVRDVTFRRKAEQAIRESERRLGAILNNTQAVIYLKNLDGRYLLVNRRFEEVFHLRAEGVIGKDDRALWPPQMAEFYIANDRKVLEAGRSLQFEETAQQDDGQTHIYVSLKFPLLDLDGRAYAVGGVSTDITDRKRAEELLRETRDQLERRVAERTQELRAANAELAAANRKIIEDQTKLIQAEKMSSIGLLASGVAHEINNPLSGMMGLVKSLSQGTVPEARRKEYFDTVQEALERIRTTVKGLLDYSRQRPPQPERLDVGEIANACLRLINPALNQKRLTAQIHVEPQANFVYADRSQLMQALMNVLLNSVHATPAEGCIDVTTTHMNGRVLIRVRDSGHGISKENLPRVSDAFFTTKPEGQGTGLGLAITLGVVKANGGELDIESEPGKGTTVTLALPSGNESDAQGRSNGPATYPRPLP